MSRQQHWDSIYKTTSHTQVGWYQASPKISLALFNKINASVTDRIIDVGCGSSLLVDGLIEQGFNQITLLDISKTALTNIKKRLDTKKDIPSYVVTDIAKPIKLPNTYDIWHDRAVFHFLLSENDRHCYMENLSKHLSTNGTAIIGTFSLNGPRKCSGLEIIQYDQQKMMQELPSKLQLVDTISNTHIKPDGSKQEYLFFIIKPIAIKPVTGKSTEGQP